MGRRASRAAFRVLDKRDQAATNTEASHWFQRASAGATAAVATLTGGTLIGSIPGTAAPGIGIRPAPVGLFAARVAARKPEKNYPPAPAHTCPHNDPWG